MLQQHRYAVLGQKAAQLIGDGHAPEHMAGAHAHAQLQVLLRHALDRNEVQVGSQTGLGYRQRITGIALVGAGKRLDMLGRHQPHLEAHRLENAAPIVGRETRLHRKNAGLELAQVIHQLVALDLAVGFQLAGDRQHADLEDQLGQVNGDDAGRGSKLHDGRSWL